MRLQRTFQKRHLSRKTLCQAIPGFPPIADLLILIAILFAQPAQAASPQEIREKLGIYVWGRVPGLTAAAADARKLGAECFEEGGEAGER